MSTFLKDVSRGYGRSVMIQVIAVLIVVPLFCVFICVPLYLVNSLNMSIWVLIISAVLFLVILFGGAFGYAAWVIYRRTWKLDNVFAPLGLTGSPYHVYFRQYHGTVEGREVSVYFYRGPVLEIEVSTPLQTRLGVTGRQGDTLFLARLFNHQPLTLTDPGLSDLVVFAPDEKWTRSLLANPHVLGLLHQLTSLESFFTRQQVILRPGALRLMFSGNKNLFRFEIAPEQARQWLDDLLRLARIAESLPTPQITAEETSAERLVQSMRNRNPYLVPAISIALVVGMLLCFAAIGIGAFLFAMAQ